jgi:hypothetical protein
MTSPTRSSGNQRVSRFVCERLKFYEFVKIIYNSIFSNWIPLFSPPSFTIFCYVTPYVLVSYRILLSVCCLTFILSCCYSQQFSPKLRKLQHQISTLFTTMAVRTQALYSFFDSKLVSFSQVTRIFACLGCCWYGDECFCFLKQDILIH